MAKAKARAKSAARKAGAKRAARSKKCTGANCKEPWVGMKAWAEKKGWRVTAGKEGGHNTGSLHAKGRAIDVSVRGKSDAEVNQFISDAKASGMNVRDERVHPPGQAKWSGPHLHLSVPTGNFPPCC
jgi:hypothetical protein